MLSPIPPQLTDFLDVARIGLQLLRLRMRRDVDAFDVDLDLDVEKTEIHAVLSIVE
jgi:hypothetical protein